jgi:iron complex outermembrane recepter protein
MKKHLFNALKKKPLAHAIGFALAANAVNVYAQETVVEADTQEQERIIVTGSRIRSGGFDEARPVDIILSDSAITQGFGDIASLLRNSTIASGSNQVTAASSTAFIENGGTGAETLSLRGLGANRTLILLNGRRAGPAGTRGGVSAFDLNVLPLSTIERVEILKDGASSIYGSDAVAGVVNIITKKSDGGNVETSFSLPSQSGGEEFRINATYGKTFKRGSFSITADYNKKAELAKGDRDYFRCGEQYIFDTNSGERADVIDPRTGNYHCNDAVWGHVWVYDYQEENSNVPGTGSPTRFQYDYDGTLGTHVPGITSDPNNPDNLVTPPGWFPVAYSRETDGVDNADHPFQDLESLSPENVRTTLFAQANYEITDNVDLYAELLLNRRKTTRNAYRQFWGYIYNENFFGGNPLSEGWRGAQYLSPLGVTDKFGSEVSVDYTRFVMGATGDIADTGWYFDLSYQNSRSSGDYVGDIIFDDSISDQDFLTGSCVGSMSTVRGVPCVDIPWLDPNFLAGDIPADVAAYMFGVDSGNTLYKQSTLEFYVSGDLFELPAGPVGAVFGVAYQKDEINDVPGEASQLGNIWGSTSAGITKGKDNTTSLYSELKLPLLENAFLTQYLDLELSGRYTDVDSYGDDTTYKVSLNWKIDEAWRVRASKGTSFRSPALFELYLADEIGFLSQRTIDPCISWGDALDTGAITQTTADNCAADGLAADYLGGGAEADIISGGGAGKLEAETSVAKTLGLIWTPDFADLSVSIDYFNIEINNEVTQLGAATILAKCYASEFFPSDPLCALFERESDPNTSFQGVVEVSDQFINIASQINKGIDVALSYSVDTELGEIRFDTQHTFQRESKEAFFADTVIDTNGEFGDPKHVATYNLALSKNNWTFNWNINYVGAVSNQSSYEDRVGKSTATYRGEQYNVALSSGSVMYHAFSVIHDWKEQGVRTSLGVANAFNKKPPRVTTLNLGELDIQGNSAFYSQYDWLGRRVFLNVSYDF